MKTIKKIIKKPSLLILYLMNKGILNWLDDEKYLKIKYRLIIGKKLNLENPKTFNEKIQWLKLNDRKYIYSTMVDKFEAKKYVADIIGEEYIIPTLGIYNEFDEIDFDELPNQFVIKPTHTSGDIFICKDKSKIDYNKLKKKVNKWLKIKYYYLHREWPYKNIKPRIIVEKYIVDESEFELKDYKVLCFNGKAKLIQVHSGRFKNHTQDFYNIKWEITKIAQGQTSNKLIKKPQTLDLMLKFSERLSNNMKHVRIDWYEVNGKLLFGEITFYDGAGFEKFDLDMFDIQLGNMIQL